jgi:sulfite reductase (NADPH) flavoprotein alpha-component
VQTADAAAALETLPAEAPAASPAQPVSKEVTILFGSQTGNAQGLAENAAKTLTERGFQVTVSAMSDFKPNQLKKIKKPSHHRQHARRRGSAGQRAVIP